MRRAALVTLLLAACADDDGASTGECRFPAKVSGFAVSGGVPLSNVLPPVAVDGKMIVTPKCVNNSNGITNPFSSITSNYTVDTGDDPAVLATVVDGRIELFGRRVGTSEMRIFGDELVATTFPVRALMVDSITFTPLDMELAVPDADPSDAFAWTPGKHEFSLTPSSGGERVFDSDAVAVAPNAGVGPKPDWPGQFTFATDIPGDYVLTAVAGFFHADTPIGVVAGADAIVADDPSTVLVAGEETHLCFAAYSQGRRVLGLMWTFEVDNGALIAQANRCTWVTTTADQVGQTVTLTVRAAGMTVTKTYSLM